MYCFEFYNCTKAQLEKRKIYGAIEENSYLKVVTSSNDSHATYTVNHAYHDIPSSL